MQEYALSSTTPGTTAPGKTYVRGSDMGGGIGGLLYSRDAGSPPSTSTMAGVTDAKKAIPSETATATRRFPDKQTSGEIGEVKDTKP